MSEVDDLFTNINRKRKIDALIGCNCQNCYNANNKLKQSLYDLLMEKVDTYEKPLELGGALYIEAIPISAINQLFGKENI